MCEKEEKRWWLEFTNPARGGAVVTYERDPPVPPKYHLLLGRKRVAPISMILILADVPKRSNWSGDNDTDS